MSRNFQIYGVVGERGWVLQSEAPLFSILRENCMLLPFMPEATSLALQGTKPRFRELTDDHR